jgi:hypothetical protein
MLDSPCHGSRTGLTPPISTSVPGTPPLAYGSLREKPPPTRLPGSSWNFDGDPTGKLWGL